MGLSFRATIVKVILSPGNPEDGSADLCRFGSPVGGGVGGGVEVGVDSCLGCGVFVGVVTGVFVGVSVPRVAVAVGVTGVFVGGLVFVGVAGGDGVSVSARSGAAFGAALPGAGATSIQAANTRQLSNHHACRGMSTSFPLRSECKALG